MAAQQVFNINELLEIIICQSYPNQTRDLKLVAKNWRDTISSSKAVNRARVVHSQESPEPAEGWTEEKTRAMTSDNLAEAIYDMLCIPMLVHPAYRGHDWIPLNPALAKAHTNKDTAPSGEYSLEITINLPSSNADIKSTGTRRVHQRSSLSGRGSVCASLEPGNQLMVRSGHFDEYLLGVQQHRSEVERCTRRERSGLSHERGG